MAGTETAGNGADGAAQHEPVTAAEIDARMRRLLGRTADDGPAHPAAHPPRDVDTACELLERASEALDMLMERCGRLERELADAAVQGRARDAEHEDAVALWQRLAGTFKAQAEGHEQAVAALQERCAALQERCADLQERCAASEARVAALDLTNAEAAGRAGFAEQLATKLHDKVVTSFGIGSRAHPALESLALRDTGAGRRPPPASGKSTPRG